MNFDVYGPYWIKTESGARGAKRISAKSSVRAFWGALAKSESLEKKLKNACGCYVFAIQSSGRNATPKPWYVGKAEKQSFGGEVFTSDKIIKYNDALFTMERAIPCLFFLPRCNPNRGFAKPNGKPRPRIDDLESKLIGLALKRNPKLINVRGTKKHKIVVHGYLNSTGRGPRSAAAQALKKVLPV